MKTPLLPFAIAALLLAGCSSKEKVVNNYYQDGLYQNEPGSQAGTPTSSDERDFALGDLEEENQGNTSQESLDYYDPQDARSNPQGNGGYSAGGDLNVNNFYGNRGGGWNNNYYGGRWGMAIGFNTWNPYIYDPWFYDPWMGPGFYNRWGARPWGWRSAGVYGGGFYGGGFYGGGFGWGWNNYNLGYAHGYQNGLYASGFYNGANDAWGRNRVLVSTLGLSGRTGSYGARGTQTTRRYDRSGKRGTSTRMGGRSYNSDRSGRTGRSTRRETLPTSRLVAHSERSNRARTSSTPDLSRSAASGGSYSGRTFREAFDRSVVSRESSPRSTSTSARPRADFRRSSRTYAPDNDRQRSFQQHTRSIQRNSRSNTPEPRTQPQRRPSRSGADRPSRSAPSRNYTPSQSSSPNRNATPNRSNSRNRSYSPSRSSQPSRSTSPSRSSSPSRSASPSRSSGSSSGGGSRSSSGRSSRSSRGR